ncbi:MAG TPA: hypothetical protein VNI01_14720 [Elusimicrobiota bacterium]|jgi:hypothetical protein|nr:hypothetical protein [Elusimicrobiota bacterium]
MSRRLGARGGALVAVMVFLALLGFLAALFTRSATQNFGAHAVTRQNLRLRQAARYAAMAYHSCLMGSWNGDPAAFSAAFAACAPNPSTISLDGRFYDLSATYSGAVPYAVSITVKDHI